MSIVIFTMTSERGVVLKSTDAYTLKSFDFIKYPANNPDFEHLKLYRCINFDV